MNFHRPLTGPLAAITCAILAAPATCRAEYEELYVSASAGPGYLDNNYGNGSRDWAAVTGKFGNSAFAGASLESDRDTDWAAFSTRMRLTADAGPRYWEKSFPGMEANIAKGSSSVVWAEDFTFANETAFQMNVSLLDPAKLAKNQGIQVVIEEQIPDDMPNTVYGRTLKASGLSTENRTLPAGSYTVRFFVAADTPEVGPTYFKGKRKSAEGVVDASAEIHFLDALTAPFLEWSSEIAALNLTTRDIEARAGELRALLVTHTAALDVTRTGKPRAFDRDFHVIPRTGGKGGYTIVPADAARVARFADALATVVNSHKRYTIRHVEFNLRAKDAVRDGHLPDAILLLLGVKVHSLPSETDKHLAALSFFKKERSYTAAEVKQVKAGYNSAAAWFDKKLPPLRKRAVLLEGTYDFLPAAVSNAALDYSARLGLDVLLSSRERQILNHQINFGH